MTTWTRNPQERDDQQYLFAGTFYYTRGVSQALSFDEIIAIYQDVRQFAQERKGIDYLQVYVNEKGEKLFFIDQLSQQMIESGEYDIEYNYCTLLFANEY